MSTFLYPFSCIVYYRNFINTDKGLLVKQILSFQQINQILPIPNISYLAKESLDRTSVNHMTWGSL